MNEAYVYIPPDASIPPLYATSEQGDDAIVQVKLFTPDSGWTFYITEYDGDDLCFGLVVGMETELGYFTLSELRAVRGPLGLRIERDLYFKPAPLREIRRLHP